MFVTVILKVMYFGAFGSYEYLLSFLIRSKWYVLFTATNNRIIHLEISASVKYRHIQMDIKKLYILGVVFLLLLYDAIKSVMNQHKHFSHVKNLASQFLAPNKIYKESYSFSAVSLNVAVTFLSVFFFGINFFLPPNLNNHTTSNVNETLFKANYQSQISIPPYQSIKNKYPSQTYFLLFP